MKYKKYILWAYNYIYIPVYIYIGTIRLRPRRPLLNNVDHYEYVLYIVEYRLKRLKFDIYVFIEIPVNLEIKDKCCRGNMIA
jgi:hypothetical protein